jgi:hypothetical protein
MLDLLELGDPLAELLELAQSRVVRAAALEPTGPNNTKPVTISATMATMAPTGGPPPNPMAISGGSGGNGGNGGF